MRSLELAEVSHGPSPTNLQARSPLSRPILPPRRAVESPRGPVIVGESPAILRVLEQIGQVAATDATVLLMGETGTGKELVASGIHALSARRYREMVAVNCGAIPAPLIESELFGHERGAYAGAVSREMGRFELADRSTLFLDEIGDLALDVQVKLLRVLETRQFQRLGNPRPVRVDTRIIAATHRDLDQLTGEGLFREDLLYRLDVFPIQIPPLRDRMTDIPLLVWRFIEEFCSAFGRRIERVSDDNMTELQQYAWPGNVRELRNVVERAMIAAQGRTLSIALPARRAFHVRTSEKLQDVERDHILSVLQGTAWRVRGNGGAAERVGLKPSTLEARMGKLGIRRPARS